MNYLSSHNIFLIITKSYLTKYFAKHRWNNVIKISSTNYLFI